MLLLNPNQIVGWSELAQGLWESRPPVTARNQLQGCVSRIRRVLPADAIMSRQAGYGIQLDPDELDASVFTRLLEAARSAADPATALGMYRQALDLWRGPACAEMGAPGVRKAAAVLDERHTRALEGWVASGLDCGHERDLLAELASLVERFPLRERLRGQLMTALHRCGRRSDALAEFRKLRVLLRDELGVEPGLDLQALHRDILNGSLQASGRKPPAERPDAPAGAQAEAAGSEPIRCLPRTVSDFTGHGEVVRRLFDEIRVDRSGPTVLEIDGMAGSGKTTLALHLAALSGDRYPDAHLFLDLHGHSDRSPVEPADALLVLLRQLGVSTEAIPADRAGRSALWRSEVSRKKVLIILDNAAASAQVAELLPASSGSLVLVTSRRRLAGLDGVHLQALPLLSADEALTLLGRIVGARAQAEPEAAAEVVRRCGGLPLAIRLAGARLAQRRHWRMADLVQRLGETALPELAVENRSVAGAFALSYAQLSGPSQRFLALLGCHPGTSIDAPAAAALSGLTLPEASELLDGLVDVHLIEEPQPGLFRLHDLLREFAAALARRRPAEECWRAIRCLLNLEAWALASTGTLFRPSLHTDLRDMPNLRPDLVAAVADPGARLERQRRDLGAFLDAAAQAGHWEYMWWIPRAAWEALFYRGYNEDVAVLHERGLVAARQHGDDEAVAVMANYLASAYYRSGAIEKAREHLQIAIRFHEQHSDDAFMVRLLSNLATVQNAANQYTAAAETSEYVLRRYNLPAYSGKSLQVMYQLSTAYQRLGRYTEALRVDRLRLLLASTGDNLMERAGSLLQIQRSRQRLGLITPQRAQRYVATALTLCVRADFAVLEAEARTELGMLLAVQGDYEQAIEEHRQAVEIALRISPVRFGAEFVHDYAATLHRSGDVHAARENYAESLRLARAASQPYSIARALAGIAECIAGSRPQQAGDMRAEALRLFEDLGTPERFTVTRQLHDAQSG
jgi:DNA-binding SARP family transcriptional activator/tetratricopeptide (TPR) repeat protein